MSSNNTQNTNLNTNLNKNLPIYEKLLDSKNSYRLKMMSDVELLSYANVNISKISDVDSDTMNLESNIFGSNKTSTCLICGQLKDCPGHYGVIQTPYPIITNTLVLNDFLKLIEIICPFCSCIPISNAKETLKLKPQDRLRWLSDEIKKYKTVIYKCPYCENVFNFINTSGTIPDLHFYIKNNYSDEIIQLNPIYIKEIINNIPDQVIEYLGFNSETYNPKNFMTNLITIIPNKLRIKTLETTNSFITNCYRHILKDILPELNKLYNNNFGNNIIVPQDDFGKIFDDFYKKLNAWYILFTDTSTAGITNNCLNALSKRDRKHIDNSSSMISRLRDKKHNYFENGITNSRHNNSARTVIGGGANLNSYQIGFPKRYCFKLGHFIPVYKENLDMIKQFVMSMTDIPKHDINRVRALKLFTPATNQLIALKNEKIGMFVNKIQPGDKIYISSMPGNIVQHCRFPCLREESWASHELVPTDLNVMTLNCSACKYKNADFDGDETQIYKLYSNVLEPECILLHSVFHQMLQYKDGTIGIAFTADSNFEIPKMKPGVLISELPIYESKSNSIIGYKSIYPKIEVLSQVEKFFDVITGYDNIEGYKTYTKIQKINYSDDKTEVINNKLSRKKYNLTNNDFYSHLILTIGVERVLSLRDLLMQLGYLLSLSNPITLGNEIHIYKNKDEIKKIKEETFEKMKIIEQSDMKPSVKDEKQYLLDQTAQNDALKLLIDGAQGTSLFSNMLLPKYENEYYKSCVAFSSIYIDGKRIRPKLLNHTRTIAGFPRFSTNPRAYGYITHNYLSNDIEPFETMYDCMLQRKGLYTKGNSIGKSGYLTKRFVMAYGPSVVDANGAVEYQNTFLSPCYNNLSINPRYHFEIELKDITLKPSEFKDKYGKFNKVYDTIFDLYKFINTSNEEYQKITNFIDNPLKFSKFVCGFNFDKFIDTFPEGNTDETLIIELVDNITKVFSPVGMIQRYNKLNLNHFIYYIIISLLNHKLERKDLITCYYYFINSLVDSGEAIGMKAAFAVTEVLSQDKLDAIHHAAAGGVENDHLLQTKSDQRFEELYGGSQHKNQVITLGFYDNDYEKIKNFANENETIYFNSLWTKLEIVVSGKIPKVVSCLHPEIDFTNIKVYNTYIRMICNLSILADYNIKLSELFNKLKENFEKIHFITGYVSNSHEFIMYIFFDTNITKFEIDDYIYTWKDELPQNIIHGKYLKNCLIVKNRFNGEYFIKANMVDDVVYEQFLYNPLFDPSKCKTTNTIDNLNIYGVFESTARLYEETVYCAKILSNAGKLLNEHFKTLAQTSLRNGNYLMAVTTSIDKNDIDYVRDIQFEQPTKFIKTAIKNGKFKQIDDPIAGETFNENPKIGDGYSRIIIFKNEMKKEK